MLRNNYQSRNLIGHYPFWVISPKNLTSFTRSFLAGRRVRAGHENIVFSTARHKSCFSPLFRFRVQLFYTEHKPKNKKKRSSYILQHTRAVRTRVLSVYLEADRGEVGPPLVCVYLEADHGEVGPHHRVKIVENVGFTQRILRLCQVTQLHRGGREVGREGGREGGGSEGGSYNIQQNCNLYAAHV